MGSTAARQRVDIRRLNFPSVPAQVRVTEVIGQDDEYVGPLSGERLRRPGRRHLKESSSIHDTAQDATES